MSPNADNLHYQAQFDALRTRAAQYEADAFFEARKSALGRFERLGFPTRKLEDWRYTNVRAISSGDFALAPEHPAELDRDALLKLLPEAPFGQRCVFVDGQHAPALSDDVSSSIALRFSTLRALRNDDAALEHVGLGGDSDLDAFGELNGAFVEDGAQVVIREASEPQTPLHLIFVSTGADIASHPRVLIRAQAGSQGTVIQDHVSIGRGASFTNVVVQIDLDANASLDYVVLQRESTEALHVANVRVRQARDSRFHSHTLSLSGALIRNTLQVQLEEPGAEARLNGAFLGGGKQVVDNHTLVDHAAPHCESHELYKGVLGGESRGVFRGRVNVRQDAQKTNATQSNPNLLITDRAEIDSKPQLEIRADDVKCSHGSTIGRLDEDAMFFLRARGLSEGAARALLTRGFAAEITERLPGAELSAFASELLESRLLAVDGALAESSS